MALVLRIQEELSKLVLGDRPPSHRHQATPHHRRLRMDFNIRGGIYDVAK